ncbi:S8 family serine peptidase [Paenarthrobacter aurescens]|uniref:S8 family serine peptidase n=1 Tax=Paenarthrobacter aurescens TaxID=43663 RepID=UPI0021BF1F9C|nr:S8 family serine peptidase [Paenarthrobacter aurescens]MCT9868828.1 S8 family serine peptidase [Paenarthrobacter aurescens]
MTLRYRRTLSAALASALAGGALAGALLTAPAANADAWRDKEFWLKETGVTNAWQVSKGAGVKVAIIDSGIDGNHPDLKGVVVGGTDVSGAGAPNGQKSIGAKTEHGTLVATMLAGRGHTTPTASPSPSASAPPAPPTTPPAGGPDGIVGVAPEAEILAVSTWLGSPNPGGKTDQEQIPDAVRWAVDNGAKVINISLGSTSPDWPQSWDAAFLYAEQKDVVIVAAAGNRVGGNIQVGAPATIPGVLTVAGLDGEGRASVDSSSQGISIGVAAPAEKLVGGIPGGAYAEWAGTSGAAPIVSGVAALIRSKWPEMSATQVINRIVSTAKDAGAPGKDPLYGYGILNAEAALKEEVPTTSSNPLGSIADWIRVHRRGDFSTPSQAPVESPTSAAPTLADPTVPAAKTPATMDEALPAVVVLGFGALFIALVTGAAIQLRRVSRNPPAVAEEAETGVLQAVDPPAKT